MTESEIPKIVYVVFLLTLAVLALTFGFSTRLEDCLA